jgi:hypothetical protein
MAHDTGNGMINASLSSKPFLILKELISLLAFDRKLILRIDVFIQCVSEETYSLVEQFNSKVGNTIKLNLIKREFEDLVPCK